MTLPDGPKSPRFVQLIQWIGDPLTYLDLCAKKYGEIFTTRWSKLKPFVMIHNPQAIQEMFNSKAFDAPGEINGILKPLLGEQSMIVLSGEKHKRDR